MQTRAGSRRRQACARRASTARCLEPSPHPRHGRRSHPPQQALQDRHRLPVTCSQGTECGECQLRLRGGPRSQAPAASCHRTATPSNRSGRSSATGSSSPGHRAARVRASPAQPPLEKRVIYRDQMVISNLTKALHPTAAAGREIDPFWRGHVRQARRRLQRLSGSSDWSCKPSAGR